MEICFSDNIISFGKYKGMKFDELPIYYLKWLVNNIKDDNVTTQAENVLCRNYKLSMVNTEVIKDVKMYKFEGGDDNSSIFDPLYYTDICYQSTSIIEGMIRYCITKDEYYTNKIINFNFLNKYNDDDFDLLRSILYEKNLDTFTKIVCAGYCEVLVKFPDDAIDESIEDYISEYRECQKILLDFYNYNQISSCTIFSERTLFEDMKGESHYLYIPYGTISNGSVFLNTNCKKIKEIGDVEYFDNEILSSLRDISYKSISAKIDFFSKRSFVIFSYYDREKYFEEYARQQLFIIASLVYLKTGIKFPVFELHNFYNYDHYVMILKKEDYEKSKEIMEEIHNRNIGRYSNP